MNKLTELEVLNRLVAITLDPAQADSTPWAGLVAGMVSSALTDAAVASVNELAPEQVCILLDQIKLGLSEGGFDTPDFLQDLTSDDVALQSTLPANPAVVPDPNGGITESSAKTEAEVANQKLEVAKGFLKELDTKLARYESLDIDSMLESLDKYESIGTVDEINALMAKVESIQAVSAETTNKSESVDKTGAGSSINKGEIMSGQDSTVAKPKGEGDDAAEKLAAYEALGTIEEIEALVARSEKLLEDNSELSEKVESLGESLGKYESIGNVDEILTVVTQYAEIKQKTESERIAAVLGLPVEKVLATIEKMESVQAAEDLLTSLFAKTEAEVAAAAELAAKPKTESASATTDDGEAATLVDKTTETLKPKTEAAPVAHAVRMTKLAELCKKL